MREISGYHRYVINDELSPSEKEIASFLAEGCTSKEIAWKRGCSIQTIKTHVTAVYNKLGAVNRAHAVAICFRKGILG